MVGLGFPSIHSWNLFSLQQLGSKLDVWLARKSIGDEIKWTAPQSCVTSCADGIWTLKISCIHWRVLLIVNVMKMISQIDTSKTVSKWYKYYAELNIHRVLLTYVGTTGRINLTGAFLPNVAEYFSRRFQVFSALMSSSMRMACSPQLNDANTFLFSENWSTISVFKNHIVLESSENVFEILVSSSSGWANSTPACTGCTLRVSVCAGNGGGYWRLIFESA